MSEVPPDPRTIKWTSADDALVVWLLLCCPFSEFQRGVVMLSNKRTEAIVSRFLEIINSPELIQRVNTESKYDIIGYKPIPWTKHETLSLIRLVHNNKKCNQLQFLLKFPMLFHPSRTASSLNATYVRLKTKDHNSISDQLSQFNAAVEKIHEECKSLELLPFPGEEDVQADPKGAIEKLLYTPKSEAEDESAKEYNIETFRQVANEKMTKKSFAALVTSGSVKLVEKCRTIFGRASPKCSPDVDLAEFNLQSISRIHCAIFLAKDLNFYIECLGNHMIMVNTGIFQKGSIVQIHDSDLIDIGGVPFVFFENLELISNLRNAAFQ